LPLALEQSNGIPSVLHFSFLSLVFFSERNETICACFNNEGEAKNELVEQSFQAQSFL